MHTHFCLKCVLHRIFGPTFFFSASALGSVTMAQIGINTWVWTSPLTTDELARLAPQLASMGFDRIEVPIEGTRIRLSKAADIAASLGLP